MNDIDHEMRARQFVDGILEINHRYGVSESSAEMGYVAAVSAAKTFMLLRKQSYEASDDMKDELPEVQE